MTESEKRTDLADDRTDLAEDRTLLANERTFAGWGRTAMACVGIGLGFQAIFREVEPTWVAKGVASVFFVLGTALIWAAAGRATRLHERLSSTKVEVMSSMNFKVMAVAITSGTVGLLVAIWVLL